MKHLKTFENIKTKNISYKIGDYVLCEIHNLDDFPHSKREKEALKEFLNHNIGKIIHISPTDIKTQFHDITLFAQKFFSSGNSLFLEPNDIIIASPNIEDIKKEYEFRQNLKKYNV